MASITIDVYSPLFAFEYTRDQGCEGDAAVAQVAVSCQWGRQSSEYPKTTFDFSGGIATS